MKRNARAREFFEAQRHAILNAMARQEVEQRIRMLASDGMPAQQISKLTHVNLIEVRAILSVTAGGSQ